MQITQHETQTDGRFVASEEGVDTGHLTYVWRDHDTFVIDHTEVLPEFRGRDIARQLVMAAVNFARANGKRIRPLCSYAHRVFDRTPEIHDVLA